MGGRAPKDICHSRLLLEGKRLLTYTLKSIAEISHALGFSEPSYFNRFFKRNTGLTPRQFRAQSYEKAS